MSIAKSFKIIYYIFIVFIVGVVPYYGLMREAAGMGGSEEAPAPAIETGENKIEVDVTITYEIN